MPNQKALNITVIIAFVLFIYLFIITDYYYYYYDYYYYFAFSREKVLLKVHQLYSVYFAGCRSQ